MTNRRSADSGAPDGEGRGAVRVLISYAHDDAAHVDRVRYFWLFLRRHGVNARIDLTAAERRQDWTDWMTQEIRDADYVLIVVSPEYRRRADGGAGADEGRGVQWEARLIRDRFYADRDTGLQRFLPVVLPGYSVEDIPLWMGPAASNYYQVSEYTVAGAERLLRLLTGQPWEIESPLEAPPVLPPRRTVTAEDIRLSVDSDVAIEKPGLLVKLLKPVVEVLRVPVTDKTTIDWLLDWIYWFIQPAVKPHTYGQAWMLYETATGLSFSDM